MDGSSGTVTLTRALTADAEAQYGPRAEAETHWNYSVALTQPHTHPCNFHLSSYGANSRQLPKGQIQFWYDWDSTSGVKGPDGVSNPDLGHCTIYEIVSYVGNAGSYLPGVYYPPDPPFASWVFNNPTNTSQPATAGRLLDTHVNPGTGNFNVPLYYTYSTWTITGNQQMRYHCSICGADELVPGSETQNTITRRFEWMSMCFASSGTASGNSAPPSMASVPGFSWTLTGLSVTVGEPFIAKAVSALALLNQSPLRQQCKGNLSTFVIREG